MSNRKEFIIGNGDIADNFDSPISRAVIDCIAGSLGWSVVDVTTEIMRCRIAAIETKRAADDLKVALEAINPRKFSQTIKATIK